jgi:hypothetical protein
MSRTPVEREASATVPYHTGGSAVAGLTRRLFKLRGLTRRRQTRPLPELTDAWFEETIREVDAASVRLQKAREQLRRSNAA